MRALLVEARPLLLTRSLAAQCCSCCCCCGCCWWCYSLAAAAATFFVSSRCIDVVGRSLSQTTKTEKSMILRPGNGISRTATKPVSPALPPPTPADECLPKVNLNKSRQDDQYFLWFSSLHASSSLAAATQLIRRKQVLGVFVPKKFLLWGVFARVKSLRNFAGHSRDLARSICSVTSY